jgi:chromosome segregation ATPase
MSKVHLSRRWIGGIVIVVALLAAGAFGVGWLTRHMSADARQIESLRQENVALREQQAESQKRLQELQSLLELPVEERADKLPDTSKERPEPSARLKGAEAQLTTLQTEMTQARSALNEANGRILELETATEKLRLENERLAAEEAELRAKVDNATRVVQAMNTELKGKTARLTSLEVANRELQQNRSVDEKQRQEMTESLQQLEDINRRRDVHLSGILRRYREITDQYRTLAARWDRTVSDTPTQSAPGNEISRINDAISLAEEDIRQLNSLNSRAAALRKKMGLN